MLELPRDLCGQLSGQLLKVPRDLSEQLLNSFLDLSEQVPSACLDVLEKSPWVRLQAWGLTDPLCSWPQTQSKENTVPFSKSFRFRTDQVLHNLNPDRSRGSSRKVSIGPRKVLKVPWQLVF